MAEMFVGASMIINDNTGRKIRKYVCSAIYAGEQKKEIREKIHIARKIRREKIWISLL